MSDSKITVLLIDTSNTDFNLIKKILAGVRGTQFLIDWINDIDLARDMMLKQSHDIYLLDLHMIQKCGVDFLKEVYEEGCRLPIIILTRNSKYEEVDREAIYGGAADYLEKSSLTSFLLERALRYAIYRSKIQSQTISRDRMVSIGMIATNLAKEIDPSMDLIKKSTQSIACDNANDKIVIHNINIISSQIQRISGLIESLLNVTSKSKAEHLRPIEINKVVHQVLLLVQHELQKEDIIVKNSFTQDKPLYVLGRSEQLQQVLLNLIINALHAIRKAKAHKKRTDFFISCTWNEIGNQYAICIKDNGCGISSPDQTEIFDPFFSTKEIGQGTGLGLTTSLWIIESWSGRIEFKSKEGDGSEFTLLLPKCKKL